MDCRDFLSLVWPATGPYTTATIIRWTGSDGEPISGFKHVTHESVEAAAQWCIDTAWDRESGKDVFFALGSLKHAEGVPHRSKEGKMQLRVQRNIAELGAFWLDIDVGDDAKKKYLTQKDALVAVKQFCVQHSFPKPTVTSSGGGVHVYWPLTEAVPSEEWEGYARLLKGLCRSHGLKQDLSRTSDCASVLRPVGTANWKTGEPREVRVIVEGERCDTQQFKSLLKERGVDNNPPRAAAPVSAMALKPVPDYIRALDASINATVRPETLQQRQASAIKIIAKCSQLSWQRDNPELVQEPQWYDMIGCLRHAAGGDEAVHRLSEHYNGYHHDTTQNKIDQHRENEIGPTRCATFDEHNPGGCDDCPHRGKVNSPIVLGYEQETAAAPKAVTVLPGGVVHEVELPEPPFPYRRVINPETEVARVVMEFINPHTEEVEELLVYEYDLYPSAMVYDEREQRYIATLKRWLPKEGWGEIEIPLGDLYDKKKLAIFMGNFGILPDSGKIEELVKYMTGYIQNLMRSMAAQTVYAQLGWRDSDKMILPDRAITADEALPIAPNKNITNALTWTPARGSLEAWTKIVAAYERPGLEALQFGFGVGFASPLLHFTGFEGLLVSMVGPAGCGKTSAMQCSNSIWGHKKSHWVDLEHDTQRAFYNKLGVVKNLPAYYDEITNLRDELAGDLYYTVSKGMGRQRLTADATAKENFGNWQLIMTTTANSSMQQRIAMSKSNAQAEASRLFEFYVPPNTIPKAEADMLFGQLNENYGLAGPVYAAALVKHADKIRERVHHWIRHIDTVAQVGSSERFWSAGAACVLAGFEVANKCGLTNADIDRLLKFSVANIVRMRAILKDTVQAPSSLFADYLAVNNHSALVLARDTEKGRPAQVSREPSRELRMRLEAWHNKLFIDRAHFRKFCAEHSADPSEVINEMREAGAVARLDQRVVLGKGTVMKGAQTWCIVADTSHALMGGVGDIMGSDGESNVVEFSR